MRWVPRTYQSAMIDFALSHLKPTGSLRCNWFAGMGVGKSSSALRLIDILLTSGYVNRVLILAPKQVAVGTWPDEIRGWQDFRHLRYAVAVGGKKERAAAVVSRTDIVIVNYDVLPAMLKEFGEKWPFDMVVADEVMKLKSLRVTVRTSKLGKEFVVGQGGKQSRSIAKLAHSRIKVWLGLTGSPAPNGLIDTWAPMWFVDAGQRLGRSFSAFKGRWFREFKDKDERTHLEPYEHSQDEIQSRIKDVCMTVEAKDFFDLPPLVESIVRVELPPDAMRMYREFEEEMFLEIAGNEIEAFDAASVTNKCRQIANGAVYTDREGNWEFIHDAKIDALRDCVEEAAGMPILVAYQFKSDVARILKAFPKAVLVDKDPETIRRWNRGEIQMLLGHPASIGHGLSLQHGGNILVDFSTGFNLEHDEQIIERIGPTRQAQSGYNRAVYRRRIVAAGTIEEYVVKRVKNKASIQQMLRDALKIA